MYPIPDQYSVPRLEVSRKAASTLVPPHQVECKEKLTRALTGMQAERGSLCKYA